MRLGELFIALNEIRGPLDELGIALDDRRVALVELLLAANELLGALDELLVGGRDFLVALGELLGALLELVAALTELDAASASCPPMRPTHLRGDSRDGCVGLLDGLVAVKQLDWVSAAQSWIRRTSAVNATMRELASSSDAVRSTSWSRQRRPRSVRERTEAA